MSEHPPRFKVVIRDDVEIYRCGLRAGEILRLRRAIVVRDHQGQPTGKVHHAGETWRVLWGAKDDPVVFLEQPDGHRHTWDDSDEIFSWFERIAD